MKNFINNKLINKNSILRKMINNFRALPNFIIIGAQKSGTTALFEYLKQHPQIYASRVKEVHYFDLNYNKGKNWYKSHFPLKFKMKKNAITGEASPYYLFHPHVAKRIYKLLPNVKLIVLLRNPTERALSHYFMQRRRNIEHLSIMEALKTEEIRMRSEIKRMNTDKNYFSYNHQHFSYKQRGIYVKQIKEYLQYFDQEQMIIINSAKLLTSPDEVLKKIFHFLGVDSDYKCTDVIPKHVGTKKMLMI